VVLAITALLSALLAASLGGEVRYALAPTEPTDLGELAALAPDASLADRLVRGTALLGTSGAIRFSRPLERDTFRLAPVAGTGRVWVELRVPEGAEGPRFVPPTSFVGRLVPMREAGLRHRGLGETVREATGQSPAPDAWLLVDGAVPASSRWAIALVALLGSVAVGSAISAARLLRPIRA
jgi:hypothetical protein